MLNKYLIISFLLLFKCASVQSKTQQQTKIDSLKHIIETAEHDTVIVNAYFKWDNLIYRSNPDLDLILNQKIKQVCLINKDTKDSLFFKKKLSKSYHNLGSIYSNKGNIEKAIEYYNKGLSIRRELNLKKGISATLNNIGLIYLNQGKYDLAKEKFIESISLLEGGGDLKAMANPIYNLGIISQFQGDYEKALEYYKKSLKLRRKVNDEYGIASLLNNIGIIYENQGNSYNAVSNYNESLKIRENLDDKKGIAESLNNLGNIFMNQNNYDKALQYYKRGLIIEEELKSKNGIAASYNNIANTYDELNNYELAHEYYNKSLKIRIEIKDYKGIASTSLNMGSLYIKQHNYKDALVCLNRSLEKSKEIGNKRTIADALCEIGNLYRVQSKYNKAIYYCEEALNLSKKVGIAPIVEKAGRILYSSYKNIGNTAKALEMHELYVLVKDSIENNETQKLLLKQEYRRKTDSLIFEQQKKEALAKAEQRRKDELIKMQNKKKNLILFSVLFILLISIIFAYILKRRLKITQTQKSIIKKQKQDVDFAFNQLAEKNNEIIDSISYAKRIQKAILPSTKNINKILEDYFILYKPKDIVAGDFYWVAQKEDTALFAAADCTGHGVPGALVSVICNAGLKRSVNEFGLTNPGNILNQTTDIVVAEFEKSDEDVKDGMDIALCSIKDNKLQYAGANNPLWILRKGKFNEIDYADSQDIAVHVKDEFSLLVVKATKQAIGKADAVSPFLTTSIDLKNNDVIYLFSDGYADQFGGVKGKKFKSSNLRKLIFSISNLSMKQQKEEMNKTFEKWKGSQEQVDDVCFMGVKVHL